MKYLASALSCLLDSLKTLSNQSRVHFTVLHSLCFGFGLGFQTVFCRLMDIHRWVLVKGWQMMAKGKQAYSWQAAISESEDILKWTQIMKA